jgi:hypothetical protein
MNNVSHVPQSETAARRVGSPKARGGRPRKDSAQENVRPEPNSAPGDVEQKPDSAPENVVPEPSSGQEKVVPEPNSAPENAVPEPAADETVTRERGLLLATLRVWELKHGIHE